MEHLSEALGILAIGMVTVFIILTLVVVIGKITIRITNRFWPDLEPIKSQVKTNYASSNTIAAISAAVDIITQGRGKVTNIKKV